MVVRRISFHESPRVIQEIALLMVLNNSPVEMVNAYSTNMRMQDTNGLGTVSEAFGVGGNIDILA